jgi:hypothetical protein
METKFKIWAMVEEFHTDPTDFSVTTMDIHESNTFVGEHDTLEGATDEINAMGCGGYINSQKVTLNKSQKVLAYIKANTPKTRKEIVTFICEELNGKAYQEGYWSVQLGVLSDRGYFKKQDGKYVVTARGEVYLMNSVLANKLPRVGRLEWEIKRLKDIIHNREENLPLNYVTIDAMNNAVNLKKQTIQYLESEVDRLTTESSKNDCGHYACIQTLEHQLSTSINNERLLEKEVAQLKNNIVLSDVCIKELENEKDFKLDEYEARCVELKNEMDDLYTIQVKYGEVRDELSALKQEPNTLTLTPPPSGEYGDFSNAQLISIIKQMIS